jgi:hypothetical protein
MVRKPFLIKNFLSDKVLRLFQTYIEQLKANGEILPQDHQFKRFTYHNDPKFQLFHHEFVAPMVMKLYSQSLRPSYNFLSCYIPGEGECPIHVDRPTCFVTVDICLNQSKPWPLYVNSSRNFNNNGVDIFFERDVEERERIKQGSEEFLMEPGDALCYSGSNHAHWRKPIDQDNFCDLVFFHFVPENFEGDLD